MQRGDALRHEVIGNKSFDHDDDSQHVDAGQVDRSHTEDRSAQSNTMKNSDPNSQPLTGRTLNRTHSSTDSLEIIGGLTMSASFADLHAAELDKGLLRKLKAKESGERKTVAAARSRAQTEIESGILDSHARLVPPLFEIAIPLVRSSVTAVVDDSFTRCFKSKKTINWNWNCYLFPMWCLGVLVRYFVLFPLRLLCLLTGFTTVLCLFPIVKTVGSLTGVDTSKIEVKLIQLLASAFVISWSGVIRMRGLRPKSGPNDLAGIFVANHSSMIDFIILLQTHPYAVVGQKHSGWVGWLQDYLLGSLNCVWFDRGSSDGKNKAAEAMARHVHDPKMNAFPALIFPEGTCVNNEYVMQFRKYVFELGVPIHPVAIKYNKIFVDGYWNSREESFAAHLLRLMTSWAMVCDVWFMETQHRRDGETGAEFATRVQRMIARRAGIKAMDWDGYMKYWKPSERFLKARQKAVADDIKHAMYIVDEPIGSDGTAKPSILKKGNEPSHAPKRSVILSDEPVRTVDVHEVLDDFEEPEMSADGDEGDAESATDGGGRAQQAVGAAHQVNTSVQDLDLDDIGMELEEGNIPSDGHGSTAAPQKQNSLLLQSIMSGQSANAH